MRKTEIRIDSSVTATRIEAPKHPRFHYHYEDVGKRLELEYCNGVLRSIRKITKHEYEEGEPHQDFEWAFELESPSGPRFVKRGNYQYTMFVVNEASPVSPEVAEMMKELVASKDYERLEMFCELMAW